jgi:hypothetical protein
MTESTFDLGLGKEDRLDVRCDLQVGAVVIEALGENLELILGTEATVSLVLKLIGALNRINQAESEADWIARNFLQQDGGGCA